MSGERTDDIETININNIQRYSERTFVCSCHWSTIELFMIKIHVNHLKSRSSLQQVAHNTLNSSCIKLGKLAFFA